MPADRIGEHAQSVVYSLNLSAFEEALSAMMDLMDVGGEQKNGKPKGPTS